jgi:hypothetical protein
MDIDEWISDVFLTLRRERTAGAPLKEIILLGSAIARMHSPNVKPYVIEEAVKRAVYLNEEDVPVFDERLIR